MRRCLLLVALGALVAGSLAPVDAQEAPPAPASAPGTPTAQAEAPVTIAEPATAATCEKAQLMAMANQLANMQRDLNAMSETMRAMESKLPTQPTVTIPPVAPPPDPTGAMPSGLPPELMASMQALLAQVDSPGSAMLFTGQPGMLGQLAMASGIMERLSAEATTMAGMMECTD